MNEDGLLFGTCAGYFFRLEHINAFHKGTDDFGIEFFDLGIFSYLYEKGINVDTLRLCFADGLT